MIPDILRKKRDGERLADAELRGFIEGYTRGDVPDYQASALLMAIYFRGLDTGELVAWTDAMLRSGDVLDLSSTPGFKVDKHSTGGVGDKISLILAPLVAAAGGRVPMISGRGLGHTGGTLDKLESIPGFRTDLPVATFRSLVDSLGVGMIGQTDEIAPADRKLYALRDVTATVECIPLIASSILSKKLAEGIDGLVLDVKTGSGAFLPDDDAARALATTMVRIGRGAGKRVVALLTDMSQPLGAMIGNALEVQESCNVLRGGGPADVRALTIELGAEMTVMSGLDPSLDVARERLGGLLDSGAAFERFERLVEAQGGDPRSLSDAGRLPTATERTTVTADRGGVLRVVDCAELGRAAGMLGAGRSRKEDRIDPAVGLEVHRRSGDRVSVGDPLFTVHHNSSPKLEAVVARIRSCVAVSDESPPTVALIRERIGDDG